MARSTTARGGASSAATVVVPPEQIQSGTLAARPAAGTLDNYYWATDVQILYRDTGVVWQAENPTYSRIISNCGVGNYNESSLGSSALAQVGRVALGPINVPWRCTIDMIGYMVGTVVAGNVRVALYEYGSYGWPDLPDTGDLVVESGSEAMQNAQTIHMLDITDIQIEAGLYFFGIAGSDATGTFYAMNRGRQWDNAVLGVATLGRTYAQAYGAFQDPCPVTAATVGSFVAAWLRVVSVP